MEIKLIIFIATLTASVVAEAPYHRGRGFAPYAPSGFRPHTPFDLPGEYVPPVEVEQQRYPEYSFEVSKQRIDFAGQEVQQYSISEPQNQYLPPEGQQPGFVNSQGPPDNRRPFFGQRGGAGGQGPNRRPHGGRPFHQPRRPQRPNQLPSFPAQPPAPPSQQQPRPLPLPNPTDERFEPQQYYPQEQTLNQPALEYGAPTNIDPRNFQQQQDSQQQNTHEEEEELEKQYALDALNAAVENYNRLQENQGGDKLAQGQYFVVNPDKTIQKVVFSTKQNEEEAKKNDFTAELKYSKVGEIKDPVYKYSAEGQLVRIVKK